MLNPHPVHVVMLFAISVIAACTRAPVQEVEWPDDLPPIDYYEQLYERDENNRAVQSRENYLVWVVRFYKGWDLYQDGWDTMTRDILLAIDDDARKDRVRRKLAALGKLISGEWAKESDNRRIRSRELSIWGQALLKSINHEQQEELVDRVASDVNALLTHELDQTDINLQRY